MGVQKRQVFAPFFKLETQFLKNLLVGLYQLKSTFLLITFCPSLIIYYLKLMSPPLPFPMSKLNEVYICHWSF
jgi:hypothetical protein